LRTLPALMHCKGAVRGDGTVHHMAKVPKINNMRVRQLGKANCN